MSTRRNLPGLVLIAFSMLSSGAWADSKADLHQMLSADGLQQIKVKGIDLAYAMPGATLAGYDKVMIDPIAVQFHKDWNPTRTGTSFKLSAEERENIRSGIAKIVYDEFVRVLQQKSTYQVVTATGPDVLRVQAAVVNVIVTAPDTMTPGRTRVYTVSAGEGTLVANLSDSETGAVIARVVDQRQARSTGMMTLTNSVVNAAEARNIAASWARILRDELDKAHGIGKR
jgi:hypothetical protein